MRILHTSDWHLGRTLHGVSLMREQAAFCDHLVEVAREHQVDAVLVAGDIYDRAIAPVEAVTLLSDAVARLAEQADVVLTPGNHDSAIRLGFGADLLRPGIAIRARVSDVATPVVVRPRQGDGPATAVYALPYLDPDATRWALGDGSGEGSPLPRSHAAVMAAAMTRVGADLVRRRSEVGGERLRAVVMAHAFVVGGAPSESERDIRVGGVDAVPGDTFGGWGLDYVALGHLHGPQAVTVRDISRPGVGDGEAGLLGGSGGHVLARYSGSPLAYSFSERQHRKSSVVVDLDSGSVELVDCPVPRALAELTGPLGELLGPAGEAHQADWLRITVTDPVRPPELYTQIKARFPHVLQVIHRPPQRPKRDMIAVTPGRDPLDVTSDFVTHVTGIPPQPAESAALRAALEAALASERSA